LACLDLDGFKQLNDTHGHAVGDEALKLATEILLNCTRETDCVGRIGGDEFAILMPNTQIVDCSSILEKLHTTIETRMSERGFAVTASIGCKNFEVAPDNAFQVLLAADKIMYEAKKRGKNCIVIY
jgi:diguanylate cyclase (GGDEF)-like protein